MFSSALTANLYSPIFTTTRPKVTVNLRCGLNETRKLVFKSAKSCECFFCKHV